MSTGPSERWIAADPAPLGRTEPTLPVVLNGTTTDLAPDTTIDSLVKSLCETAKGIAVARNSEVVPRSQWARTALAAGDRIEIVTATAGG